LRDQDLEPQAYEVVVVDDGSGDSTVELLETYAARWSQLIWRTQTHNRGPAAARNVGTSLARGRLILFVDDDIVASRHLLSGHESHHQALDGLTGVVGRVEWHPDLVVTPFMRWLDSTDLQFAFATMSEGPVARPWEAFYTCNLSLPARLLEEVGGFDERFPYPAFEDIDLGLRLSQTGFRLEYRPGVLAWHARAVTLEEFCRRMRKVGESATLLRAAQPDLPFDLPLQPDGPTGWRRLAAKALPLAARLIPAAPLQTLSYRAQINQAYREGVAAGLARASSGVEHSPVDGDGL
jgi:glycosyltransferase involved in cell wall biosynthesis